MLSTSPTFTAGALLPQPWVFQVPEFAQPVDRNAEPVMLASVGVDGQAPVV
jgi:hypothetical protein